ncbi:hypothetical protein GDO78_006871 [Eleutherodactylus coqui]|uniref:E3 ubiquitin-protein ligase UHRF n=1 Tax=Eleutherodactylus coqui TaxID=57060 RepID=A0A8J6FG40_ELECQ|nr:hypothetical protein GDO78_006871 [Eleutherodactylus coqui]
MWIQVRTIDGTETRTIDDLSRLTKIEGLRLKIQESFNVTPDRQRLFYRGKQLEDGHTLFDYNVGLNDIVQLLIRSQSDDATPTTKKKDSDGKALQNSANKHKSRASSNQTQPSTSARAFLIDAGIGIYKVCACYPENGIVEIETGNMRPRARTTLKWSDLKVGAVVMVNYNIETPEERGFWFDAEITDLKENSRTNKEVYVKILLGGPVNAINDCKVMFPDEIYKIEKPGAYPLSSGDGEFKRKSGPECKHCKADPNAECRFCSCYLCGGKQDAHMQLLCDECNMAYHIYCLNPPLSKIPEDEDWYCPSCKNDSTEVVKAGEKLKQSKKKAKMPSASTESQRDWGKVSEAGVHRPHVGGIHGRSNDGSYSLVLAGGFEDEVDRGDEFTYTGSGGRDLSGNKRIGEHSFDQTLTHMNRALALNCDAALNDKDGAESKNWRAGKPVRVVRSSKGRRISKYAPEDGNRYDGIYKVVKYWPEIGKCGFLVWRYLLRRDDVEPAPWTAEGIERSKKLGLTLQYPEGYLEAMANKEKKEKVKKQPVKSEPSSPGSPNNQTPQSAAANQNKQENAEQQSHSTRSSSRHSSTQSNGNQKRPPEDDDVEEVVPAKLIKRSEEAVEAFQLTEQQHWLIKEDTLNQKLWDEALSSIKEGPKFLKKVEQTFMCVCCQELVFQPVTTACLHNVCKSCLQRSFRAEVYTCPACRYDLGKTYNMVPNKVLQTLLDQFFPGYNKGR